MGEIEPGSVRERRQNINELEDTGVACVAFGIIFELSARSELLPDAIEVANKVVAGGSGVVAVGAFCGSVLLRYKNRRELRNQEAVE